jgi:hypothetical protein
MRYINVEVFSEEVDVFGVKRWNAVIIDVSPEEALYYQQTLEYVYGCPTRIVSIEAE